MIFYGVGFKFLESGVIRRRNLGFEMIVWSSVCFINLYWILIRIEINLRCVELLRF